MKDTIRQYWKSLSILLLVSSIEGISCTNSGLGRTAADSLYFVTQSADPKYDLKRPVKKYFLPYVLEEISGLSFYKDDMVACIQDESGKIFFYDLGRQQIVHTVLFEYSGDYEGIEIVDEVAYIVKSNGDLFQLTVDFSIDKKQAAKYETSFGSGNNIEGLGYDPKRNSLLLVTKDEAGIREEKHKDSRGIYAFDLAEMSLRKEALFIITENERRDFYKEHRPGNSYDDKRLLFKPSAIAVHPNDGNYYILASVGKLLLVLSPGGDILESYTISPGILIQPEGICFSSDGTMYIASEGDGDRGYILEFDMKN